MPDPNRPSMKVMVPFVLIGAGVIAFFLYKPDTTPAPYTPPPRPAKLFTVTAAGGDVLSFPATVRAGQRVQLSFEVGGQLVDLPIREGETVKAGQVIARLDPADFQSRADAARAKRDNAKETYERSEKLLADGVIAKREFDTAKAAFDAEEANVRIVEKALEDTVLRAPFDGIVAERNIDAFVSVQPKQPIISLQNLDEVELIIHVPDTLVAAHNPKDPPKMWAVFASLPDRRFAVTLREFKTEGDRATQTFQATLVMPQPADANILPNMTATVYADAPDAASRPIRVPVNAVVADTTGPHVWVVDPTNQPMPVKKRAVTVGTVFGEWITVTSGLSAGETVIATGASLVNEGDRVTRFDPRTLASPDASAPQDHADSTEAPVMTEEGGTR